MSNHPPGPDPDRTATGATSDAHLVVDVVVDAASVGHAVQDAVGNQGQPLTGFNLLPLLDALGHRHLAVRKVAVSYPCAVVAVDAASDRHRARDGVAAWQQWWKRQADEVERHCGLTPVPLPGAFDGNREIGVDDLAAWQALQWAGAIADGGDVGREAVVVVSADSDMWDLASLARPVRVFVAGPFEGDRVHTLLKGEIPFLALTDGELAGFAAGADPVGNPGVSLVTGTEAAALGIPAHRATAEEVLVVARPPEGGAFQVSSPLNRLSAQADGSGAAANGGAVLDGARTVVVADPYSLHLAARRAIGVGGLAGSEALRQTIELLGWDAPVAVLAVVPDLSHRHDGKNVLPDELVKAWWERDTELDALAAQIVGDPRADARRAELRVVQRNQKGKVVSETPSIKRMSTGMVAELWRATRLAPDARVVILTEDADIEWFLQVLPRVSPGVGRPVRVGLHAQRVDVVDGPPGAPEVEPGPVVILTEHLAAGLVGAMDRPYSRTLRDRLGDVVRGTAQVTPSGIDPETRGLMVRIVPMGDTASPEGATGRMGEERIAEVDTVVHLAGGALRQDVGHLAAAVEEQGGVVGLRFDPSLPCAVPEVVVDTGDHDASSPRQARVVAREGHRLWVDVDFDGVADMPVPAGHDTTSYRPDDVVTIQPVTGSPDRWAMTDPGAPDDVGRDPHEAPAVLEITERGVGGASARDIDTGDTGWVEPLPGEDEIRPARHLFAVPIGRLDDGTMEWMAMSSGLAHLDEMLGGGEPASP